MEKSSYLRNGSANEIGVISSEVCKSGWGMGIWLHPSSIAVVFCLVAPPGNRMEGGGDQSGGSGGAMM